MKVSDFTFELPARVIAQTPMKPRDYSRLLVMDRVSGECAHHRFFELSSLLSAGDVLVFNNSKVIKARLHGRKETGGKMEVFLVERVSGNTWEVLVRGKGAREGGMITFGSALRGTFLEQNGRGETWIMKFSKGGRAFDELLLRIGEVPLPPYITKRSRMREYQTIYAKVSGSVAAPTAGLHFTPRLLRALRERGVQCEFVTLHVGLGTFQPVKTARVEDHHIHAERAMISAVTAKRLNSAKREGRRIIAVGTTSVRTLETFADARGHLRSGRRNVRLFIYPGYDFHFVDAMITNFHLPKSSLLMLVSAFASREHILQAYETAIRKGYRFYSFGDAMFIE